MERDKNIETIQQNTDLLPRPIYVSQPTDTPTEGIITRCNNELKDAINGRQTKEVFLLHELGHATLGHSDYNKDIELLSLERAAWDQAELLAQQYNLSINENLIEDHLDTYRDWLHSRSLCPQCSFTGLQTGNAQYSCPACHAKWRVNQARTCGLKRYITK
jgi:hypothetical protein